MDDFITANIEETEDATLCASVFGNQDLSPEHIQGVSELISKTIIPTMRLTFEVFSELLLPMELKLSRNTLTPLKVTCAFDDPSIDNMLLRQFQLPNKTDDIEFEDRLVSQIIQRHMKQELPGDFWLFSLLMMTTFNLSEHFEDMPDRDSETVLQAILPSFQYLCDDDKEAAELYRSELAVRGFESNFEQSLMVGLSLYFHQINDNTMSESEITSCKYVMSSIASLALRLNRQCQQGKQLHVLNFLYHMANQHLNYQPGISLSLLGFMYSQMGLSKHDTLSTNQSALTETGRWAEGAFLDNLRYFDFSKLISQKTMKACLS